MESINLDISIDGLDILINISIDELDELISAIGNQYMDYDETRSESYNASIRRYNDEIEALSYKLKEAYRKAKENEAKR